MHAMNAVSTTTMPMDPLRMAVPPPPGQEIRDGDTVVGWIEGMGFGFLGFGNEDDAVNAAWVAYRTMARRFATITDARPVPIDTEPMSLHRSGDVELILAGGRPIATLVRPGVASRSGPDSFGFELQLPVAASPQTMRSTTQLVYRTMRRAGIRWTMWIVEPERESATAGPRPGAAAVAGTDTDHHAADAAVRRPRAVVPFAIGTVAIVAATLVAVALPVITLSSVVYVVGVGLALVALSALAGLVGLVVTDVREFLRGRGRPARPARLAVVGGLDDGSRPPIARA